MYISSLEEVICHSCGGTLVRLCSCHRKSSDLKECAVILRLFRNRSLLYPSSLTGVSFPVEGLYRSKPVILLHKNGSLALSLSGLLNERSRVSDLLNDGLLHVLTALPFTELVFNRGSGPDLTNSRYLQILVQKKIQSFVTDRTIYEEELRIIQEQRRLGFPPTIRKITV